MVSNVEKMHDICKQSNDGLFRKKAVEFKKIYRCLLKSTKSTT